MTGQTQPPTRSLPATGDDIRKAFLRFFEERGHKIMPSSSLVPQGDPTLLLTSAGMVQFKPYFTGERTPPNRRLASCQKCFRTTDIDAVGDFKHLTFFEMLGNFSIGDYFKKEAIEWGWEFVTRNLQLPPERLWISIFLDDDEALQHWRDVGVPAERIVRCGEEDNFWGPAGETGPCGPCSEIHYDFGPEWSCGQPTCGPTCDCGRFVEVWNLVFTQYFQDAEGRRTPLPRPNIDTGMGLERVAAVMQGVHSFYDADVFAPLVQKVCHLAGRQYGQNEDIDHAVKIIAEHGRAATFLIADGVVPSNEGRGYVLRRVIRRAEYYALRLLYHAGSSLPKDVISQAPNIEEASRWIVAYDRSSSARLGRFREGASWLPKVAEAVMEEMGKVYPELVAQRNLIISVLGDEEQKFRETLVRGEPILWQMINLRTAVAEIYARLKQPEVEFHNYVEAMHAPGSGQLHPLVESLTVRPIQEAIKKG
ncbi:MAG: alanine--tRNA ligase-related protein, partial [Chloroflexota bacterium]